MDGPAATGPKGVEAVGAGQVLCCPLPHPHCDCGYHRGIPVEQMLALLLPSPASEKCLKNVHRPMPFPIPFGANSQLSPLLTRHLAPVACCLLPLPVGL